MRNVITAYPLPPAPGKLRIAFSVPEQAVIAHSKPPALRAAACAADCAWEPALLVDALESGTTLP